MPLIPADNDFAMWAVMLLLVALVLCLEKTSWGQKISGTIMVITLGALLSNFGIIARSSAVFDSIGSLGVPIAIVLLLCNANLKKIFSESGPTLLAFCFGALGTTLGVIVGVFLLPLGEKTPELAAIFSATFIGGSVNFVAVSNAIGFDDSNLLTASIAADNVVGVLFMVLLIAIPSIQIIAKIYGYDKNSNQYLRTDEGEEKSEEAFSVGRAVFALGFGFLVVGVSGYLAELIGYPSVRLLIVTTITVAAATIGHKTFYKLTEAFPVGLVIMYLFLGMIGAGVDIVAMLESGLLIAVFAIIILTTHLLVILLLGRLFKIGLPEMLVGSNACILGPPTAAAMAGSMGWKTLITPAILCGTFGYAIANFIGLALFGYLGL